MGTKVMLQKLWNKLKDKTSGFFINILSFKLIFKQVFNLSLKWLSSAKKSDFLIYYWRQSLLSKRIFLLVSWFWDKTLRDSTLEEH